MVAEFDDEAGYLVYRDDPEHRRIIAEYLRADPGQPGGGPVRELTASAELLEGFGQLHQVQGGRLGDLPLRREPGSTVAAKNRAAATLPW